VERLIPAPDTYTCTLNKNNIICFWGDTLERNETDKSYADYIVIKAEENGVNVIGLTRGKDTRLHHTEILDKGELLIAQFTEQTSAIKIRGKCTVHCRHGVIESGSRQGGHL
jgi:transcription attenuation protein (tryptophan RNA-binding attenuator protein)